MNILYVVVLLSVICHVLADVSGDGKTFVPVKVSTLADRVEAQKFGDAVERGDLRTVYKLFEGGTDEQKKYYGEYLVGLGSKRLAELIKKEGHSLIRGYFLGILTIYAEQVFIDEIIEGANLSNEHLSFVAYNTDLACKPDKFIDLLQRITQMFYQYEASFTGIGELFTAKKIKCVEPLVHAIENAPFLFRRVKEDAIQTVFWFASDHPSDERASIAKQYHDHPLITAKNYKGALNASYENGGSKKELFKWLLARADRKDLKEVRKGHKFDGMAREFQDAVNDALSIVGSETRHERGLRRRRVAAIDDALKDQVPTVLVNMIAEYDI